MNKPVSINQIANQKEKPCDKLTKIRYFYLIAIFLLVIALIGVLVGLVVYFVVFNPISVNSNNFINISQSTYFYNASYYTNNSCGLPSIKPNLLNTRIINGYQAVAHSWPWIISLGYSGPVVSYSHVCAGSLISSSFILTAAHCVEETSILNLFGNPKNVSLASLARVYVGVSNINTDKNSSNTFRVKNIIRHPLYNSDSVNLVNDLALIELTQSVTLSSYVSLGCVNQMISVVAGDSFWAIGWGQTSENKQIYPTYLMQVQIAILSANKCSQWNIDGTKQICAGTSASSLTLAKDTCSGDSGGPVMIEANDGRWFIVGIVSFGDSPCNGLGVYTNVKAFYSWINSYVSL